MERQHPEGAPLSAADPCTIGALIAVMAITIFQATSIYQLFNVNPIWIQQHVAQDLGGFQIPIPWYQSLNSVFSILAVPLLFWIWRLQATRQREPDKLAKIGAGAWITAASNLVLVAEILGSGGALIHPVWPFHYSAGLGIGFIYYWPTLLALVSRSAPARVNATLMGFAFMSLFISNNLIGWLGGFYENMSPAGFRAMHAAIGAAGGLLVLLLGRTLGRTLRPA